VDDGAADELEAEGGLVVRTGRDLLVNGRLAHAVALFRQGYSQAREHLGEEGLHVGWRQAHEAIIALDRSFGLDPSAPLQVGPSGRQDPSQTNQPH
jgi:hypothetical protein